MSPAPDRPLAPRVGSLRLNFRIAVRFLLAKKRAMSMSLAGIVFGVAFFVVTQAQTTGFEKFFIKTIWATNGAIRVQDQIQDTVTSLVAEPSHGGADFQIPLKEGRSYIPGVQYPALVMEAVRSFSSVAGVSEVLRGRVDVTSGFRTEPGEVLGIRLADHLSVSNLQDQIRYGDLTRFGDDRSGALIGVQMAQRLQVDLGDTLLLQSAGERRRYRISAIFATGVEEFDKRRVFVHLPEARLILQEPRVASFLQVNLFDNDQADVVADQMQEALQHHVNSWRRSERSWLEVFRVFRFSAAITMSVIIIIAGLGMFNTLAIIVMERRREIAILRSMGYSRRDVIWIFLHQGAIVLVGGTVLGFALAFLLTLGIERVPIRIRGILSADRFVVEWSAWHYLWATLVAAVVVLVASYIPARRAAGIEPGDIIRGTGG